MSGSVSIVRRATPAYGSVVMVSCYSDSAKVPDPGGHGESRRSWMLGLIYWMTLLPLCTHPHMSGNVWSRYMTVESIVERGTLVVAQSPLLPISGTPDLVQFRGKLYSDKPPVLSVMAAALYAPLAQSGVRFSRSPNDFVLVNFVLVAFTAAVCAALTVTCLHRLLQRLQITPLAANVLALAFGYGSLLLPYAITFNNHAVAAGLLTAALTLAVEDQGARLRPRRSAAMGALVGLAAVVDLPAGGTALVVFGVWLMIRDRKMWIAYLAGAAPLLLLHGLLQSFVTGSPLPAELYPEAFLFPGSYWATEAGTYHEAGPRWQFALEMLVGPQGWLTVTPVLALGLAGVIATLLGPRDPHRAAAWCVAAISTVVFVFYIWFTRRTDFAGQSYGTRHALAISPLVYYFAVVLLVRCRSRAICALFGILVLLGALYAVQGVKDPWTRIERRSDPVLRAIQHLTLYQWSSYRR